MRGRRSSSAQAVTLARAHLTWLGVVDDPHAEAMLTRRLRVAARLLRHRPFDRIGRSPTAALLAGRTRYFDESVVGALDAGIGQVVVTGAGYDSRAWRLARPGVRWFEVDHPATQADKRRRAPAGDGPVYVPADLRITRVAEVLPAHGLDPTVPSLFLLEGVVMYLPRAVLVDLLVQLADVAGPGSRLAVNCSAGEGAGSTRPARLAGVAIRAWKRVRGEPILGSVRPQEVPDVVRAGGWQLGELVDGPTLADRYLRDTALRVSDLAASFSVGLAVLADP